MTPSAADRAETLALQALTWMAGEGEQLGAFLASAGMGPDDLRRGLTAAGARAGLLGGVLDFLLADDAALIAFSKSLALDPTVIVRARRALPGAPVED